MEKQQIIKHHRKQVAEIFFDSFDFKYLDENGVWLPIKLDEQIIYEHKDVLGKTDYKIKVTPRELIKISLINAIVSLKESDGELKEQMHRKYDNYILYQWYPLDGSKVMKLFKLKMEWKF